MQIAQFRRLVWGYWRAHGRHSLPWRRSHRPYPVLVSEIMLQQTQVDRVIPYYRAWLKKFPTVRALANAPLSEVLIAWQGLGYNRRAKMLHEAAKLVVEKHAGKIPLNVQQLEALPGIGHYTARAVAAFAGNQDAVFLETNLRTAIIHHFYTDRTSVTDAEILDVLEQALPRGRSRDWYAALMDYGAHLKRSGIRTNARAAGHAPQKAFSGSAREARGAIVRALSMGKKTHAQLTALLGESRKEQITEQLMRLVAEGIISKHRTTYTLPN